jgi:hypothetical protein
MIARHGIKPPVIAAASGPILGRGINLMIRALAGASNP